MKLAEKLVHLRKEKDLSQYDVASALNVSRQAISRWESGSSAPSTDNLKSLSVLYDVSVDCLLDDSQDVPINGKTEKIEETSQDTRFQGPQSWKLGDFIKKHLLWCCLILIFAVVVIIAVFYFGSHINEEERSFEEAQTEKLDPGEGGSFFIEW